MTSLNLIPSLSALNVVRTWVLPTPGDDEHPPIDIVRQGDTLYVSDDIYQSLSAIQWPATRERIAEAVGEVCMIELPHATNLLEAFTRPPEFVTKPPWYQQPASEGSSE